MKLAIMQPYLFPYIGYFQLMAAVDRWVVYDDVAYIKQGWINRNALKVNGARHVFTVPVAGASSFSPIHDVAVDARGYGHWLDRFLRTLRQSYGRARSFAAVYALVERVVAAGAATIAELDLRALLAVRDYLGLATSVVPTSRAYGNAGLRGQDRVLDICAREGADTYVNAPGGVGLYDVTAFASRGLGLYFIEPRADTYPQAGEPFLPNLSIIDVLMHNDAEEVARLLAQYRLAPAAAT